MSLTTNEKRVLKIFLDELSDHQSNAGCNDFELDNTPENFELLVNAIQDSDLGPEDKVDYLRYHRKNLSRQKILTSDHMIFDYLKKKVLE